MNWNAGCIRNLLKNVKEAMNTEELNTNLPPVGFAKGIDPDSFYGPKKYVPTFHTNSNVVLPPQHVTKFNKLLGPSLTWKVFKKQEEVIQYVSRSNSDLMAFTFQTANGYRCFLAAHPVTFWHYDEQRNPKDRNTYEIIREFETCKLYFDLEFEISINPDHDGSRMVNNFITLVISALKQRYEIELEIKDVLNLDSSTKSKFSCHLIFQMKNCYFRDNYNVGFFVKQLCHEIRLWIKGGTGNNNFSLLPRVDVSRRDIEELEITNSKGNKKLFCDETVYSKNRHFRLYKSSKFGNNARLLESPNNKFVLTIRNEEFPSSEYLFLHSLITWVNVKESHRSLEFPPNKLHYSLKIRNKTLGSQSQTIENYQQSPFPEIDELIVDIVNPGTIYRSVFFKENSTIAYDIIGNRFCLNIGRPHKSNNVKYIVDLHTLTYYQKCYDPDCADFKSSKKPLPINEHFFLNNNIDDDLIAIAEDFCQSKIKEIASNNLFSNDISDEEFCQFVEQGKFSNQRNDPFTEHNYDVEMASMLDRLEQSNAHSRTCDDKSESEVFSDGVSEEDMIALAERCESELNDSKNCSLDSNLFPKEICLNTLK